MHLDPDEMPPALDDHSAADLLRLHWKEEPVPMEYAKPVCCCQMSPRIDGATLINAGCQLHGLKSGGAMHATRTEGMRYSLGR